MTETTAEIVEVVCTECHFSKQVEKRGEKPAEVILEHGYETGHTLRIEDPETSLRAPLHTGTASDVAPTVSNENRSVRGVAIRGSGSVRSR